MPPTPSFKIITDANVASLVDTLTKYMTHIKTVNGRKSMQLFQKIVTAKLTSDHQVFDSLARILEFILPCSAVLPHFIMLDNKKILDSIAIAFNKAVNPHIKTKIDREALEILDGLVSIGKSGGSKIAVLSKIMPMHEYLIGSNYGDLCNKLEQTLDLYESHVDRLDDNSMTEFVEPLRTLCLSCYDYSISLREAHTHFNDPSYNNSELNDKELGFKNALENFLRSNSAFVTDDNGKLIDPILSDGSKENCVYFMKLNFILGVAIGKLKNCIGIAECETSFNKCIDCFVRAMKDIDRVSEYLRDNGQDSIGITFVDNERSTHCELAMLHHLILNKIQLLHIEPDDNGCIEIPSKLLDSILEEGLYLGISKLSCAICFIILDYLGLKDLVRGSHGILYHKDHIQSYPSWSCLATDPNFMKHLEECLNFPANFLTEILNSDDAKFSKLNTCNLAHFNEAHSDAFSLDAASLDTVALHEAQEHYDASSSTRATHRMSEERHGPHAALASAWFHNMMYGNERDSSYEGSPRKDLSDDLPSRMTATRAKSTPIASGVRQPSTDSAIERASFGEHPNFTPKESSISFQTVFSSSSVGTPLIGGD